MDYDQSYFTPIFVRLLSSLLKYNTTFALFYFKFADGWILIGQLHTNLIVIVHLFQLDCSLGPAEIQAKAIQTQIGCKVYYCIANSPSLLSTLNVPIRM